MCHSASIILNSVFDCYITDLAAKDHSTGCLKPVTAKLDIITAIE